MKKLLNSTKKTQQITHRTYQQVNQSPENQQLIKNKPEKQTLNHI